MLLAALPLGGSVMAAATGRAVLIADFDASLATQQGGLFHVFGGDPSQISDTLRPAGKSSSPAWVIEFDASAPQRGCGAAIPLFANDQAGPHDGCDATRTPCLVLRLVGELNQRRMHIDICPDAVDDPQRHATRVRTLAASDLDKDDWRNVAIDLPLGNDGAIRLGVVRLTLEGTGAGWFAVDHIYVAAHAKTPAPGRHAEPVAAKHELRQALWVWETPAILASSSEQAALIDWCQRHAITDLFWQIPYSFEAEVVRLQHTDAQRALNAAAARAGIRMHALDGASAYVWERNHARMFALVAALDAFNQAGPAEARFAAVHLDNEPYTLSEWREPAQRRELIDALVTLNRKLHEQVNAADMQFGIDIPFWFDTRGRGGAPKFPVATDSGDVTLLEALMGCVDNVGVMSYRPRVTGPNGVVALCKDELAIGERKGVEVFPAIELGTGPLVEAGITFGPYPASYFEAQRATLLRTLARQPACAGLAIHYYGAWRALESRE